jgi:hypothetical protein
MPRRESAAPRRKKLLKDRLDPRWRKSRTDSDEPQREKLLTDKDAPRLKKSMTDRENSDPSRVIPNTAIVAPTLATPLSDRDDPN